MTRRLRPARISQRLEPVDTLLLGGGPAGVAFVAAAAESGTLERLLERGFAVVDPGGTLGAGSLRDRIGNTDTNADVFLETFARAPDWVRPEQSMIDEVSSFSGASMPLRLAGRFMDGLGTILTRHLVASSPAAVISGRVRSVAFVREGGTDVSIDCGTRPHDTAVIRARNLILAGGGWMPTANGAASTLGITSDEAFQIEGFRKLIDVLRRYETPRIDILGGGHSAFGLASALLSSTLGERFGRHSIRINTRRPVKVYYVSAEEAATDKFTGYSPADMCPDTGRIFRFGGLRSGARELFLQSRRAGGRVGEDRICVTSVNALEHSSGGSPEPAVDVSAIGYEPRRVPIYVGGRAITVGRDRRSIVDERGRVVDDSGRVLPGLFALGMGAGWRRTARTGGEPSYLGEVNGIWAYQHLMAPELLEQLVGR